MEACHSPSGPQRLCFSPYPVTSPFDHSLSAAPDTSHSPLDHGLSVSPHTQSLPHWTTASLFLPIPSHFNFGQQPFCFSPYPVTSPLDHSLSVSPHTQSLPLWTTASLFLPIPSHFPSGPQPLCFSPSPVTSLLDHRLSQFIPSHSHFPIGQEKNLRFNGPPSLFSSDPPSHYIPGLSSTPPPFFLYAVKVSVCCHRPLYKCHFCSAQL